VVKKTANSITLPDVHTATEFLRGQASKIFDKVSEQDTVVIVNKHSRPQIVIISYERYKRLKEKGADI
jgi:prevent-host-death family protein